MSFFSRALIIHYCSSTAQVTLKKLKQHVILSISSQTLSINNNILLRNRIANGSLREGLVQYREYLLLSMQARFNSCELDTK